MEATLTIPAQVLQPNEKAEWQTLSDAILKASPISSLDTLLHQALDAWLIQCSSNLRWRVATSLYTSEEVSLGRAAEIAGLNYVIFMEKLREEGISLIAAQSSTERQREQRRALIHSGFNLAKK